MNYQIAVTITVKADSEQEARARVGDFISDAFVKEYDHIVDYSIDEIQDVYGDREWSMKKEN